MNVYYAGVGLLLIISICMLVRELRKAPPPTREELEFKFRTGQITHDEMVVLEAMRAADRAAP